MIPGKIIRDVLELRLSKRNTEAVLRLIVDLAEAQDQAQLGRSSVSVEAQNGSDAPDAPDAKTAPFLPDKERSPTPPKEINPPSRLQNAREKEAQTAQIANEFEDQFWPAYPHKVDKPDARKAFENARLGRKVKGKPARDPVPLETILAGVKRYVATKPKERAWLNPATFLNQERWADSPAGELPLGPQRRESTWEERAALWQRSGVFLGDWGTIEDVPAEYAHLFAPHLAPSRPKPPAEAAE